MNYTRTSKCAFVLLLLLLSGVVIPSYAQGNGVRSFAWTDKSRTDTFYGKDEYREVSVTVWYPAEACEGKQCEYAPLISDLDKALPKLNGVPEETIEKLRTLRSKSRAGLKVSKKRDKYPVLLFSPSLGGHTAFHTGLAEALADLGYVVVGVNHKFESWYIINEEGRVVPENHRFHDELKELRIPEDITDDEYREKRGERLRILGEDLIFVLNKLGELNQPEFDGRLELSSVGAFGHSVGGAAAMEAANLDKRITAVINFDGTPSGQVLREGIKQPFMMIEDKKDLTQPGNQIQFDRRRDLCEKVAGDCYRVLIPGADHNSFSEFRVLMDVDDRKREPMVAILETTRLFVGTFFDKYLKGREDVSLKSAEGIGTDVQVIVHKKR
ncbi:MAG: dienelactone hydrolase family protein [Aridibacter famidurans]|nr:dienelactone hydrolase family protein [Aridibacter famidurans]